MDDPSSGKQSVENRDTRAIIWFDIDNTLYSASSKIADAMGERIHAYFLSLGLADDEATELHHKYYRQYGLALRGLVRYHSVDPLDFDRRCDGSLPLESMLTPNPAVRQLLKDIDRSKARVWALTNAYTTHAKRVLKILDLEDQFEGLVYCDYAKTSFSCKPEAEYFTDALEKAGVADPSNCYFIDDSRMNIQAAENLGWGHCVHFCEFGLLTTVGGVKERIDDYSVDADGSPASSKEAASEQEHKGRKSVRDLEELRSVWPEIFL